MELCDSAIGKRAVLNKMCTSLQSQDYINRFWSFPEGYCREYGLSLEQIHAVKDLDILNLLNLG